MEKKNLTIDVETSAIPRHYPWVKDSYLTAVGMLDYMEKMHLFWFIHNEIGPAPFGVAEIKDLLISHDRLIGHNLKFDYHWLKHLGLEKSTHHMKFYCTQEAEFNIRGQDRKLTYNLHDVSERHDLKPKIDKVKFFWDSGYDTKEIPLRILKPYLIRDIENAYDVFRKQMPLIKEYNLLGQVTVQMEKVRTISDIEWNGMKFDMDYAKGVVESKTEELDYVDFTIRDTAGWNLNVNSKDDLSLALYGGVRDDKIRKQVPKKNGKGMKTQITVVRTQYPGLNFKPLKGTELKKNGFYKTDKGTLKQLKPTLKKQKTMIEQLQARSGVNKDITTFLGKKGDTGLINKVHDGYLHSKYNNTVAVTGRLSSSDPNGQNMKRGKDSVIKKAIIPRFDLIGDADLSQLEWRVAAFQSKCPVMYQEIRAGMDQHTIIGDKYFNGDRQPAKIFNFRMIYGGTPWSYFLDPDMPDFSIYKWQSIHRGFYEHYHGLKTWHEKMIGQVQKQGWYQIATGRWFKYYKDDSKTGNYRDQKIKNYPVQGMATADISALAAAVMAKKLREAPKVETLMIGVVHDSMIFDMPKDEMPYVKKMALGVFERLPKYIKSVWGFDFDLPLSGEFKAGPNYAEVEEV